jgi:hypothetical protein
LVWRRSRRDRHEDDALGELLEVALRESDDGYELSEEHVAAVGATEEAESHSSLSLF